MSFSEKEEYNKSKREEKTKKLRLMTDDQNNAHTKIKREQRTKKTQEKKAQKIKRAKGLNFDEEVSLENGQKVSMLWCFGFRIGGARKKQKSKEPKRRISSFWWSLLL